MGLKTRSRRRGMKLVRRDDWERVVTGAMRMAISPRQRRFFRRVEFFPSHCGVEKVGRRGGIADVSTRVTQPFFNTQP
jgi:hypothetical protein